MLAWLLSYNEMNFGTKEEESNNKHDGKKKKEVYRDQARYIF